MPQYSKPLYYDSASTASILSDLRPLTLSNSALQVLNGLLDEVLQRIVHAALSPSLLSECLAFSTTNSEGVAFSIDRIKCGIVETVGSRLGKECIVEAEIAVCHLSAVNALAMRLASGRSSGGEERRNEEDGLFRSLRSEIMRLILPSTSPIAMIPTSPLLTRRSIVYVERCISHIGNRLLQSFNRVCCRTPGKDVVGMDIIEVVLSEDDEWSFVRRMRVRKVIARESQAEKKKSGELAAWSSVSRTFKRSNTKRNEFGLTETGSLERVKSISSLKKENQAHQASEFDHWVSSGGTVKVSLTPNVLKLATAIVFTTKSNMATPITTQGKGTNLNRQYFSDDDMDMLEDSEPEFSPYFSHAFSSPIPSSPSNYSASPTLTLSTPKRHILPTFSPVDLSAMEFGVCKDSTALVNDVEDRRWTPSSHRAFVAQVKARKVDERDYETRRDSGTSEGGLFDDEEEALGRIRPIRMIEASALVEFEIDLDAHKSIIPSCLGSPPSSSRSSTKLSDTDAISLASSASTVPEIQTISTIRVNRNPNASASSKRRQSLPGPIPPPRRLSLAVMSTSSEIVEIPACVPKPFDMTLKPLDALRVLMLEAATRDECMVLVEKLIEMTSREGAGAVGEKAFDSNVIRPHPPPSTTESVDPSPHVPAPVDHCTTSSQLEYTSPPSLPYSPYDFDLLPLVSSKYPIPTLNLTPASPVLVKSFDRLETTAPSISARSHARPVSSIKPSSSVRSNQSRQLGWS